MTWTDNGGQMSYSQGGVQGGKSQGVSGTRVGAGPPPLAENLWTEAYILTLIDQQRGMLQMTKLTRGTGVAQEYVAIHNEYLDFKALTTTLLNTLNLVERQKRWPTAMTEVALSGKTLDQVMAGYGVAIANSETNNRIIGRIAVWAKARIRAAATMDQKKQIYKTINWAWKPAF